METTGRANHASGAGVLNTARPQRFLEKWDESRRDVALPSLWRVDPSDWVVSGT